jgi:predicted RNA binding protein YcfA (HicA-like mRNA interferase family)
MGVVMNGKVIVKKLEAAGWISQGKRGSHEKLINPDHPELGAVIVPIHGAKDVPIGTLKSIERQAKIKF